MTSGKQSTRKQIGNRMFTYVMLFGFADEIIGEYATREAALVSLKIEMRRFYDEPNLLGVVYGWSEGHDLRVSLKGGQFIEREWASLPSR